MWEEGREGGRGEGGGSVIIETEMHIQLLELAHLLHTVFFVLTHSVLTLGILGCNSNNIHDQCTVSSPSLL